jgi:hypothetical protein
VPLVLGGNEIKISSISETRYGREISFKAISSKSIQVLIRRYYFPGWNVFVDGKMASIKPSGKEGLIAVTIPAGTHVIKALWQGTLVENIGNLLSAISLFLAAIFLLSYEKLKKLL